MELANLPVPTRSGPLEALQHELANQSRSSDSRARELEITTIIARQEVPDLLHDVLCHRTVCRLDLRWTPARLIPYMSALGELQTTFATTAAVSGAGEPDARGERALQVYLSVPAQP